MSKLIKWLKGKKSYIVAGSAVLYAILGWKLGYLSPKEAVDHAFAALGLATLRGALK